MVLERMMGISWTENVINDEVFNSSEGRWCNKFAHSDKSVKRGRQVHVTLLFDKIKGSTLEIKCFR